MVENCPPKYKNLNRIQSFSEQGYATIQLMKQACMNDEWLRRQVLQLNYKSSPSVRKWMKDIGNWIDDTHSYGHTVNNNQAMFNKSDKTTVVVDFSKDVNDIVDWKLSDVVVNSYQVVYSDDGKETSVTPVITSDGSTDAPTDTGDDIIVDPSLTTNDEDEANMYSASGYYIANNTEDLATATESTTRTDEIKSTTVWRCELPKENEAEKTEYVVSPAVKGVKPKYDLTTRTTNKRGGTNASWYVGFDKSKMYYVKPKWIKDWTHKDIPSVARGQTFKATSTGTLESIDLRLNWTGNVGKLYVQIWGTKKKKVKKTKKWDNKTRKIEYEKDKNGKYVYEKVIYPDTEKYGIKKPLAQAVYNPTKMQPWDFVNIVFDKQIRVTKGHTYFIALFSPLTEYNDCPKWGGWGRNCAKDQKYPYGYAFTSEDNGRHWERWGKNDDSVDYKHGKWMPQDFAFQCHIRTRDKVNAKGQVIGHYKDYYDDDVRYLYLKPILTNPITKVSMGETLDEGDTVTNGKVHLKYQCFVEKADGTWDWMDIGSGLTFTNTHPRVLLFRAVLWREKNIGSNNEDSYGYLTPYIERLTINIDTLLPTEMYVRTCFHEAKASPMLQGSVWGKLYAPFKVEDNVTCTAEIITNDRPTSNFKIMGVDDFITDLDSYTDVLSSDDYTNLKNKSSVDACVYLEGKPNILTDLKNLKTSVYIKPYETSSGVYRLSFTPKGESSFVLSTSVDSNGVAEYPNYNLGGLEFTNNVAYPILECEFIPNDSNVKNTYYGEWKDYTFDYDNNILQFRKDVLKSLPLGVLNITYNPVFIDGLKVEDVGTHTDSETGLKENGLILDYFKETIIIDDTHVKNRRIPLKVAPVDPIKEVVLNRDTDLERELYEDFDYTLDVDTNELVFTAVDIDGVSSILSSGDVIEIVYTPNLDSTGVCVGYYAKRTQTAVDANRQCYIDGGYWEYRV